MKTVPYWRLSGLYFFHYSILGGFVPFIPLFLENQSFSSVEIGQLLAICGLGRVFVPIMMTWIADIHQGHLRITRFCAFMSIFALVFLNLVTSFGLLAVVLFFFGALLATLVPLNETIVIRRLDTQAHRYGQLRVWGSVGFILMSLLLGKYLEHNGFEHFVTILVITNILYFFNTLLLSRKSSGLEYHFEREPFSGYLKDKDVWVIILISFLLVLSHGPYYTLFSVYLENTGYDKTTIGLLWAIGVIAEIIVFMCMPLIFALIGTKALLLMALLLTGLRWWMTGAFVEIFWVIVFAQVLHAASYALFHSIAIKQISSIFTPSTFGRGQALYSSIGFALATALGSLASGYFWEVLGEHNTFYCSALLTILACVVTVFGYIERDKINHAIPNSQ